MEVKNIAVIGAGNMGHGIARTAAIHGFQVSITDKDSNALREGIHSIEHDIEKHFVAKGKMTGEQASEVRKRLRTAAKLEDAVSDVDLVIEAIFEDLDLKKKLFSELDRICLPRTILGSNTSTLSITSIGSATKIPGRVIGIHFLNPPDVNPLVEVAPGLETSEETVDISINVCEKMGKVPLRVKDTPDFIINRFTKSIFAEAATLVMNGIASPDQIDLALRKGIGLKIGPCEMMDYAGIDLIASFVAKDPKYQDIYLFQRLADAGRYGRKNGRGFYDYSPDGSKMPADFSNLAAR